MSITFIINFKVKQTQINKFSTIMQSVKTELPKVEGCHKVDIYIDTTSPNSFTLVEFWQSEQSHQSHIKQLSDNGEWAKIAALLDADPIGHHYKSL